MVNPSVPSRSGLLRRCRRDARGRRGIGVTLATGSAETTAYADRSAPGRDSSAVPADALAYTPDRHVADGVVADVGDRLPGRQFPGEWRCSTGVAVGSTRCRTKTPRSAYLAHRDDERPQTQRRDPRARRRWVSAPRRRDGCSPRSPVFELGGRRLRRDRPRARSRVGEAGAVSGGSVRRDGRRVRRRVSAMRSSRSPASIFITSAGTSAGRSAVSRNRLEVSSENPLEHAPDVVSLGRTERRTSTRRGGRRATRCRRACRGPFLGHHLLGRHGRASWTTFPSRSMPAFAPRALRRGEFGDAGSRVP